MGVFATVATGVRIGFGIVERELRCEDDLIAKISFGNEATHEFFAQTLGVDVRGIDKIATCFDVSIEDRLRDFGARAPALGTEGHRAEAERTHDQTRTTEGAIRL